MVCPCLPYVRCCAVGLPLGPRDRGQCYARCCDDLWRRMVMLLFLVFVVMLLLLMILTMLLFLIFVVMLLVIWRWLAYASVSCSRPRGWIGVGYAAASAHLESCCRGAAVFWVASSSLLG